MFVAACIVCTNHWSYDRPRVCKW